MFKMQKYDAEHIYSYFHFIYLYIYIVFILNLKHVIVDGNCILCRFHFSFTFLLENGRKPNKTTKYSFLRIEMLIRWFTLLFSNLCYLIFFSLCYRIFSNFEDLCLLIDNSDVFAYFLFILFESFGKLLDVKKSILMI